jgi:hypothetical protein
MEGSFNHGRLYYRCAASRDFVRQHKIDHPPCLYLREDSIAGPINRFLHQELGTARLPGTLHKLADAQHRAVNALDDLNRGAATLRQTLTKCDTKLKKLSRGPRRRGRPRPHRQLDQRDHRTPRRHPGDDRRTAFGSCLLEDGAVQMSLFSRF